MTNLEIIQLIIVSIAIVLSGLSFLFVVLSIYQTQQINNCKNEIEEKNSKRSKKRIAKKIKKLTDIRKKRLITTTIFILISGLMIGAVSYIKYYQSINLSDEDSKAIVQGYYLINDTESNLNELKNKSEDIDKVTGQLELISSKMSSFAIKKGSKLNTKEGQIALNRYYYSLTEFGSNLTVNIRQLSENDELVVSFLKDVEKVQEYQKVAFKYFKVDEKALSKEGKN